MELCGVGGANSNSQVGDATAVDRGAPNQIGTATNWSLVSAGATGTYALKTDGSFWAWGYFYGIPAGGTSKSTPFQIGTGTNWTSVSAGGNLGFGLAVKSNGTLWTWGYCMSGELGNGTTGLTYSPAQVGSGTYWSKVSAGYVHALGLRTDGTLWTWGGGTSGQLGIGSLSGKSSPVQVGTMTNWSDISAGPASYHVLGVKTNGNIWTWGSNTYGQLGYTSGFPVKALDYTDWSTAAVGASHTLAVRSGMLYSSGLNSSGQLGTGNTTTLSSLVQVGTGTTWSSVTAGFTFSSALKSDYSMWAWGGNGNGQLGLNDGTTSDRSSPVQIGVGSSWAAVSAGSYHTLAVKTDGSLYAYGSNAYGQTVTGVATSVSSPVQIGSSTAWTKISAGTSHNLALMSDGTMWCWGVNSSGQLGDGTTNDRWGPTQIGTGTSWTTITAGALHSSAIKTNNTLWSWGYLYGTGFGSQSSAPTQIGTGTSWAAVAAGGNLGFGLAVKTDGTLWSWGYAMNGELGNGTATLTWAPGQVGTGTYWSKVAAGYYHSTGIRTDGTIWAWGANTSGQFGVGNLTSRSSPVQIGTASWAMITTGPASYNTISIA